MGIKSKLMAVLYNSPLEVSINMRLRYAPVVAKLKKIKKENKNIKVLEVGSGSKGITRFFRHPVTGIDVEFQEHKNKYLKEVVINPNKKYPFKDNSFDVVIAVDSIEHIPRSQRRKALEEMLRIAKGIIMITCPFTISKWDKKVLAEWPKDSATYKNVKEHLDCGIPQPKEIEDVFKNCRITMIFGEHSALSYYIKFMERSMLGKVFARTILKIFLPVFSIMKGSSRRYYFIEK